MIPKSLKIAGVMVSLFLVFPSCVKDVDFSQVEDFEINPVVESSLVFFDEAALAFVESGSEIEIIQDFIFIEFFKDPFLVDNLEKADFLFVTKNTINRGFELQVDFLDNMSELQHSFSIIQEASLDGSETMSEYVEVFEEDTLLALKNTSIIVFTLRLLPGPPINDSTQGRIELKSLATFYFNIRRSSE
jgi:hypothetical protein